MKKTIELKDSLNISMISPECIRNFFLGKGWKEKESKDNQVWVINDPKNALIALAIPKVNNEITVKYIKDVIDAMALMYGLNVDELTFDLAFKSLKSIDEKLSDRMKRYEYNSRVYVETKLPLIIRLDGKAFHTFTRKFNKPFDDVFADTMKETAKYLCENISGCKFAYTQSDEISLLITDYDKEDTAAWYDNNLQKIVSVSASMATLEFNRRFLRNAGAALKKATDKAAEGGLSYDEIDMASNYSLAAERGAVFDSRAFVLPVDEVCNYFIWRQQDAMRNSVQMVAHKHFSEKNIVGRSVVQLKAALEEVNDRWENYPLRHQRGCCVIRNTYIISPDILRHRWDYDVVIPMFTESRDYIERFVKKEG